MSIRLQVQVCCDATDCLAVARASVKLSYDCGAITYRALMFLPDFEAMLPRPTGWHFDEDAQFASCPKHAPPLQFSEDINWSSTRDAE